MDWSAVRAQERPAGPPVSDVPPPLCWLALLTEQSVATQTQVLALTGAFTVAAGEPLTSPTCAVPSACCVFWLPPVPPVPRVCAVPPPACWLALLPEHSHATQTVALP